MSIAAALNSAQLRVLLVEDNPGDAEWIRTILAEGDSKSYEVRTVTRLSLALDLVRSTPVDVVLLDLMLPDSTHLQTLDRLQKAIPETPIVLLTNLADEEMAAAALQRGAQDYLVKGDFDRNLLARTLRYAIERQRVKRELEQANRAKDDFLALLSHELRTPLTPMLGWIRMLRSGTLDQATVLRGLEVIERNVKVQGQLVEDLLDISRIISGQFRIQVRPVDLVSVIQDALEILRPAAQAKDLRLETALDAQAGAITGDPDRLRQVVWNLLRNAIKFTAKQGRISVRLERLDPRVRVTVRDDGEGIAPAFLPRLFERFSQEGSGTARPHGGLGLGLSIVRHIVELHGGSVTAESQGKGQGAAFIVTLPREAPCPPAPEADPSGRVAGEGEAAPLLAGVRVLLVEDEADAREFVVMALEQWGAQVAAVASARAGLDALAQALPDVLVSDLRMPGMDGYEFIRQVRARPVDGIRLPAIALTAAARAEDRMRALRDGYQVHMPKPVDPADLARVIDRLVRMRGKGQERLLE